MSILSSKAAVLLVIMLQQTLLYLNALEVGTNCVYHKVVVTKRMGKCNA